MKYLLVACILTGCGWFEKDNDKNETQTYPALAERDSLYCELSKPLYEQYGKTTEKKCDAVVFTSLHALMCDYVDPSVFEFEKSGKLCRRPGCTCFDNNKGGETSDSGFSKDGDIAQITYYSAKPDKALAKRVLKYTLDTKNTICNAADTITLLSKCVRSPNLVYLWSEIEKKGSDLVLEGLEKAPEDEEDEKIPLVAKSGSAAHLDILNIITEFHLYKGISDSSLQKIKDYSVKQPNNLLFQALAARFVNNNGPEIAERLKKKFPADRLPTSSDWCEHYLWQRDELKGGKINKDWEPCEKEGETHSGTDYLTTSYILQL